MNERPVSAWSQAALGCVVGAGLALGFWLRAKPLAGAFLFGDELHTLPLLDAGVLELLTHYDAVGSGLALPLIQKASVAAFGVRLPVLRAVAFVPSLLLVGAVAWLARDVAAPPQRRAAAAVSALLVATGSLFVFYGHFGRSYSLAALLCIATLACCERAPGAVRSDSAGRGDASRDPAATASTGSAIAAIALFGGLACWAHLTSVFFLVGTGLGVGARVVRTRGLVAAWRAPSVQGLALAAALGVLLHLPAHEGVMAFVGQKDEQDYYGSFGAMDVVRVLAGSNAGAWAVLVLLCWGIASDLRARGWRAAPLVGATCLAPVALVWIAPFGDAYAYARYLMPSAATAAVLIATACARTGTRLRARFAAMPAALPGAVVAALLFCAGPLGPGAPRLDRFANTYLGLYELPAFTGAPPPAPAFYAELAREGAGEGEPRLRIVEAPPIPNRAVHYLAALALWHAQDVRIGTFGPLVPGAPPLDSDLYVDLSRTDVLAERFDRLVVHRRWLGEIRRAWQEVYSDEPAGPEHALMERHRIYGRNVPGVGDRVFEQLTDLLGEPAHVDDDVVVWSRPASERSESVPSAGAD